jgi:hypothetical protein
MVCQLEDELLAYVELKSDIKVFGYNPLFIPMFKMCADCWMSSSKAFRLAFCQLILGLAGLFCVRSYQPGWNPRLKNWEPAPDRDRRSW